MPRKRKYKRRVTESELRRLLLSDRPEDAAALTKWEEEKSAHKAAKLYEEIAASAGRIKSNALVLAFIALGFTTVIVSPSLSLLGIDSPITRGVIYAMLAVWALCFPFIAVHLGRHEKTGRLAAQWLLEHGERRCLTSIAQLWNPHRREAWMTEGKDAVFAAILSSITLPPNETERNALHGMLYRAFPYHPPAGTRDFTEAEAEIICAAMRCLAQSFDADTTRLVRRIARYPVPENVPNRKFVCDIARAFLGEDKPVVTPTAIAPTASVAASAEETHSLHALLRRSGKG